MGALRNASFVPRGPKVAEAMESVARERDIDQGRVLAGLPHPSGANAERIAFFLDRKDRAALSAQVAPDQPPPARAVQIGSASCMERAVPSVYISVVAGSIPTKIKINQSHPEQHNN